MKTTFDITDIRKHTIELYKLKDLDKTYTFYYDETNNIRKFYIKENAFNSLSESNFILGGFLHEEKHSNSNLNELLIGLNLQKTSKELKLKHISKGDFIESIKSLKLNYFLKWISNSELYVHYLSLNIFYFSIVDIVDSALLNFERHNELELWYINLMKNDLYKVANIEKENFIKLFYDFEYPNIKKERVVDFIDRLIDIISPYENIEEYHLGISSLRQLLDQSIKAKAMIFIMDEVDFILLKDFSMFYINPIYMFKNSEHIFDKEEGIEEIINNFEILYNGELVNSYKFVDSKNNIFIQISDVFIGILGKFSTFINTNSIDSLEKSINNMNSIQKDNFKLIHSIIDKSHKKNKAFIYGIVSHEEREKCRFVEKMINNLSI